jgi:hypothetical protein
MGLPLIFKSPIDGLLLVGCQRYITANTLLVLQRKQLLNFLSWIRMKLLLNGKIGKHKLIFMLLEPEEISIILLRPSLCTPILRNDIFVPIFKFYSGNVTLYTLT